MGGEHEKSGEQKGFLYYIGSGLTAKTWLMPDNTRRVCRPVAGR